ncbi:MAG: response regulator [Acidobacteriota bacterium]
MKVLIVEDDPTSQMVLRKFLEPYGQCETAIDGHVALTAFRQALDSTERYDLVCLDIMMPGISGHEVLEKIRAMETERKIFGSAGVKVVMTTALHDSTNILQAFRSQCEAYLIKPIDRLKLVEQLRNLGLTP